jgi:integrase
LKAFLNVLVRWQLLEKSPCVDVKAIRIDETTRPYLSRTELSILLSLLKGSQLYSIVLFAVLTGLRLGEIVHLTWEDISLEKNKIVVRSNGNFRTKSGRIRTVPINSDLQKLLGELPDRTGLLFKNASGTRLRGEFVSKKFKKAVVACKLNPRLHFHSLRHTFGSYLVEQGVSLFHVQQLMGHSSPYVTQIYAHLGNAELMESVERIHIVE